MKLLLHRRYKGNDYTIGSLYVDGIKFCDTLEDRDRGLSSNMSLLTIKTTKIFGKTAIPTGEYTIDMHTVSPTFKNRPWAKQYNGIVPRLLDVKGFGGVLIHVGNCPEDTNGCVLVGDNKVKGQVINSTATFHKMMAKLIEADNRGEEITIVVE